MCPEKSSADTHASFLLLVILYLAPFSGLQAQTQEKVFSGPQPGESTTHFDAIELRGDTQGETVDPILENAGNATTLVFVHGLERSMVPLMKVIDAFGERYKTKIKRLSYFNTAMLQFYTMEETVLMIMMITILTI